MEEVRNNLTMETVIQVSIKMVSHMVMENTFGKMAIDMKVSLYAGQGKAKVS